MKKSAQILSVIFHPYLLPLYGGGMIVSYSFLEILPVSIRLLIVSGIFLFSGILPMLFHLTLSLFYLNKSEKKPYGTAYRNLVVHRIPYLCHHILAQTQSAVLDTRLLGRCSIVFGSYMDYQYLGLAHQFLYERSGCVNGTSRHDVSRIFPYTHRLAYRSDNHYGNDGHYPSTARPKYIRPNLDRLDMRSHLRSSRNPSFPI